MAAPPPPDEQDFIQAYEEVREKYKGSAVPERARSPPPPCTPSQGCRQTAASCRSDMKSCEQTPGPQYLLSPHQTSAPHDPSSPPSSDPGAPSTFTLPSKTSALLP
ncbi:hypothetical protein G4228_014071 [Cervus hanglu yarkandensis]|nr:hypothetical protein G4228_014071 [Cervus hanglu yarkandensis]